MTDHVPKEVLERIKKLERMASSSGGASENEMYMALEAIRRLRDQYDISDDMLKDEPDTTDVVEETAMEWNRLVVWQEQLAFAIADLFDCSWYIKSSYKGFTKTGKPKYYKGIRFYGLPRDVRVACEVYEVSYYTIRMMMRMAFGGGNWNVQHRSYAEGICLRLRDRVREIKKRTEQVEATTAIVLAKGIVVKEYGLSLNLRKKKSGNHAVDPNAHALGYKHGDRIDLTASDRKVRRRSSSSPKRLT